VLAIKAEETIVKMAAVGPNSVCFCCTSRVSGSMSPSEVRDFPHLGQKVAFS